MIPAPFEYFAPKTLSEAIELLQKHGPDAKILAGGQSLIPLMNTDHAAKVVEDSEGEGGRPVRSCRDNKVPSA